MTELERSKNKRAIDWALRVCFAGVVLYLVNMLIVPGFVPAPHAARLSTCEANLKTLGSALEEYQTDNHGHYPSSLQQLVPKYLKAIPQCPEAGADTYSQAYRVLSDPDGYSFYCAGNNHEHAAVGQNFPQYNSVQGLVSGRARD